MNATPIKDLVRGDQFRVDPESPYEYMVLDNQICSSNGDLRVVRTKGGPDLMTPHATPVYPTSMERIVQVHCLVGDHDVPVKIDLATQTIPTAVLCGDCDVRTTAKVLQWMKDKKENEDR